MLYQSSKVAAERAVWEFKKNHVVRRASCSSRPLMLLLFIPRGGTQTTTPAHVSILSDCASTGYRNIVCIPRNGTQTATAYRSGRPHLSAHAHFGDVHVFELHFFPRWLHEYHFEGCRTNYIVESTVIANASHPYSPHSLLPPSTPVLLSAPPFNPHLPPTPSTKL